MTDFSPETHRARCLDYELLHVEQLGGSVAVIFKDNSVNTLCAANLNRNGMMHGNGTESGFDLIPIAPEVRWDELPKGTLVEWQDELTGDSQTFEFNHSTGIYLGQVGRDRVFLASQCRLAHPEAVHPYYRREKPTTEFKICTAGSSHEVSELWWEGTDPDGKPWKPVVNGRVVE